jgi:adhesin/invasin
MEPTSTTLPADGLATTTLTATVQDRYGNMVLDGTPVTLTTNLGAVTPFTAATSDGVITATFQAGLEPGLGIVTATSEGISATLPVTLTPLPPQALALSSSAATLFADGQSTAVLTATVTDRIGNGVYESVSVTFAASHGSLAPVVQSTAHGVATATLTAPLDLVTAHITATTGTLSDTLSVAFVPAAPYTVSLVAQSASLPADGNATTILTATVTDEYGHPVRRAPGHVDDFVRHIALCGRHSDIACARYTRSKRYVDDDCCALVWMWALPPSPPPPGTSATPSKLSLCRWNRIRSV